MGREQPEFLRQSTALRSIGLGTSEGTHPPQGPNLKKTIQTFGPLGFLEINGSNTPSKQRVAGSSYNPAALGDNLGAWHVKSL
jgi:hypothetical protein